MGYKTKESDAPAKNGRPTKLTRDLVNRIANHILAGNRIETAYLGCGVTRQIFSLWCERGRKAPRSIYGEFLDKIQIASSAADFRDLQVVDKEAQKGDWKAAAWRLERRNAKHFGQKQVVEHVGADGGPIKTAALNQDQLDEELRKLEESLKASEE